MNVAHIIPPAWVSYFPKPRYRMVLANWAVDNDEYIKAQRSERAFVILDNGAFEKEQVTDAQLQSVARRLQPDLVVLPDVPGESKDTARASWEAADRFENYGVMFVPQGKNPDEWKKCLDAWLKVWKGRDQYMVIGVASLVDEHGGRQFGSKTELVEYAASLGMKMHILGLTLPKYFAEELLPLAREKNVLGVDTSTAFALGARGILLTPEAPKHRLGDPNQYDELSTHNRRLIELNSAILDHWVRTGRPEITEFVVRKTASRWEKWYARGFADLKRIMRSCGMPSGPYLEEDGVIAPVTSNTEGSFEI